MGVDAMIFVRRKGEPFRQEDLYRLAEKAARDLPNIKFCTSDFSDCSFELCRPVRRYIAELNQWSPESITEEILNAHPELPIWQQDGSPIIGNVGEQFIEIHTNLRYFDDEYFRGVWPEIDSLVIWLQNNIPDGQVWYAGDGNPAFLLTAELRDKYTKAYMTVHGSTGNC
jgi:hypothetical protein